MTVLQQDASLHGVLERSILQSAHKVPPRNRPNPYIGSWISGGFDEREEVHS